MGELAVVRQTHPTALMLQEILLRQGGLPRQEVQPLRDGERVEKDAERVGIHCKTAVGKVGGDMFREAGAAEHQAAIRLNMKRIARCRQLGAELH